MTKFDKYIGLYQLCNALNTELGYTFSVYDVVYFIRHVSIAIGCKNACSHCFSNSPISVTQTSLLGFTTIIQEIGDIITQNKQSLSFFHLGAANDPAHVKDYYKYLHEWRNAMPHFQTIKVFTHGWNLYDHIQQSEFDNFLEEIKKHDNIKVVISFDSFSKQAHANWEDYISNISQNLTNIISCIGMDRVRVEVFYSPERLICDQKLTLEYYRDILNSGGKMTNEEIVSTIKAANPNSSCSKVTLGVLRVFQECNLDSSKLIPMSRDCESIFPAGRGKHYFKNASEEEKNKGLIIQKNRVLYSLKNYSHKYHGVIINPDGTCQLVDYQGYKIGKMLNNGKTVITYMKEIDNYNEKI